MPARAGVRALLKETHVTCISKENAAGVKNKSGRKNFSYRHAEKELSGIILHFQWEMRKTANYIVRNILTSFKY